MKPLSKKSTLAEERKESRGWWNRGDGGCDEWTYEGNPRAAQRAALGATGTSPVIREVRIMCAWNESVRHNGRIRVVPQELIEPLSQKILGQGLFVIC